MIRQFEIPLSTPHLDGSERRFVAEAFDSNWIAPLGPQVDAFEGEFADAVGSRAALALISGTAGLHLALVLVGVQPGDEVMVSTLTFVASVNPIRYLGAVPVLVDSEANSWNLDADLVAETLRAKARAGRLPKAVVAVHLYGQSADLDPIAAACNEYGVPLIEDAAEALGARYGERSPGTIGRLGVFSFNGNKIITTSGGGMLVGEDPALIAKARKLAAQAREPAAHYEHTEIGYNYRMSNLLAAVGRGQLRALESRVEARRRNFEQYRANLEGLPGIDFMPEAPWGRHTRWLTTLTIDPGRFGADQEAVRSALAAASIEARPVWKPMHQQPLYRDVERIGGSVADRLFERGLCLPSGSNLSPSAIDRVSAAVRQVHQR
ncbi:MAG: aminotransferase class I/II-fold pyridoxal phosphate-dependent enzyme [Gemmatimonadales bacterium]